MSRCAMVIEEKIRSSGLVWTNIQHPTHETLEALEKKYGFHELDLEDCLSKTETPKIEEYRNYVFIVFHFPLKSVKSDHFAIGSLNVFIGNDFLITLSNGKLKKLEDFFEDMQKDRKERQAIFKKGSGYLLYEMMNELFDVYLPYISQLNRSIRDIEEEIFGGKVVADRLYDIMTVRRQIISLKRALTPHTEIILALEHLHKRFINKQLELYFDDVGDKIARSKSNLMAMDEMIDTLHNANESLTSHNTNRVMTILTIFSVTMLPLTFLTGLYGMNISLPLEEHPHAFLVLVGVMTAIFVFFMLFFRFKRYL